MRRTSRSLPAASDVSFAPGELLPRLAVRDETGQGDYLLAILEGNPSVLLCLPQPANSSERQAARRFAGLEFKVPRLARALLVPPDTRGADVVALSDLGLKVYVVQGMDQPLPETPTCVISDTAGRVLKTATLPASHISRLGTRVHEAFAPEAVDSSAPFNRAAPVLMIPDVLTAELCQRLIAHFEQSESHPSGVLDLSGPEPEWRPDPAVKRRRDLQLEDPVLIRELEQAMGARVLPEIRKCFHYVVTHHEPFKLVRYDEGSGYFRPHRDNETADTDYRRFAMTLNLNTGEYEGGALQFPEFGPATYRPPRGGAIVFSCSLLHEATDVTRGRRHVLLGFFYNPNDGLTPDESRRR